MVQIQLPIIDSFISSNTTVAVSGGTKQTVVAVTLGSNNVTRVDTAVRTVVSGQPITTAITSKFYAAGQYPNHAPARTTTANISATRSAQGPDGKYPVVVTLSGSDFTGGTYNASVAPYSGTNGVQPHANPFSGMADDDVLNAALSAKNLT